VLLLAGAPRFVPEIASFIESVHKSRKIVERSSRKSLT